jgi:hypothetical protein
MTNDDGLPIETTSWYNILDKYCTNLGENINLLISNVATEKLHEEFVLGSGRSENICAWSVRYVFIGTFVDNMETLIYVPRNPTNIEVLVEHATI